MLLPELMTRLAEECDVVDLLEMLDISGTDLLEAFYDRVADKAPMLEEVLSDTSSVFDIALIEDSDN